MKKGFTLIEMLVSAGIMALLSVVITQIFVATTRNSTKTDVLTDVRQNGNYALGVMERMIRSAKSVTVCGVTPTSSIEITNEDNLQTTFTCVLDGDSGVSRIASDSGTIFGIEYLTNNNFTVGSCASVFTCISGANYPSVAISFQLQQKSASASQYEKATETFITRVTLRN